MSKDSGECGELFVSFARIGLAGFGGVLPFAHRELVERKRWLSEAEFSEVLGLGQILPGSNIVNLTVMVGLQRGGWAGAACAFAGLLIAPAVLALVIVAAFDRIADDPRAAGAVAGMAAAAVGLLFATGMKMQREFRSDKGSLLVCGLTVLAIALARLPLDWVLPVAAALSLANAMRDPNDR